MSVILDTFCRTSIEDPKTPITWDDLADIGGGQATSGEVITPNKALRYAPVWRAVNLLSGDVGKVPLFVYKRVNTGKERDPNHPAYKLLRYKPNTDMTAKVFKQTMQGHALLTGNGYAFIQRRGNGDPIEMWPLDPARTWPVRESVLDQDGKPISSRLMYVYQMAGGQERKLDAFNVLHIPGLGYDGLTGYSVISYARDSLGLGMGAHKYSAKFFANSARPSVIIEHPGTLSEPAQDRWKKNWSGMYSGLDNAHRTAILEEGMKANIISIAAKDAQLLESMAYSVREVSNWFGVPPHKLGDNSRTAFASLEQENQSYLDDSLDAWFVTWEEECRAKLLTQSEQDRDTHVIEFLRQALVRANLKDRAIYFRTALAGAPWMTIDEVRGRETLNELDDGEGADILIPTNNFGDDNSGGTDGGSAAARTALPPHPAPTPPNSQVAATTAARAALTHARGLMRTRVMAGLGKLAKGDKRRAYVANIDQNHGHIMRAQIGPPAAVVEALTGEGDVCESVIAELAAEVAAAIET